MHGLLNKDGFGLSQRCLSSYLGVSQSTVSGWIKRLVEIGLIKPISKSYIVGLKAKSYIATGMLKEWIVKNKNSCNYVKILPQFHPVDGQYYSFFLSLSRRCISWSDYKLALSHVNDIDKKGRLRMAYAIRRCDERKSRRALDENEQVQRITAEGNGSTL
jgi:DNA-binding Lrp family transcriptional regulator